MDKIDKNVILICTGFFQDYMIDNIQHLLSLNFQNIYVITESIFFDKLKNFENINKIDSQTLNCDFDSKTKLNSKFRNGFWTNTSKRLFLLYEFMKKTNIKNVIHIENDVLLYKDFDILHQKIYLTMDCKNRCIPGIIYIPKYELLDNLIENYDYTKNDMENLAKFFNKNRNIVNSFPIINNSIQKCIFNEYFDDFNQIFDGAAIGQYLGGIDPKNCGGRNTIGFVNEKCIVKYNNYKFEWIYENNLKFPFILINNVKIPIVNLHIHSKNLKKFVSKNNE